MAERSFIPAPPAYADLLERDVVLAELNGRFPGIRQIRQLDLFTALVRCISAQQVNLRWAVTTRRRLAETFGERHEVAGHVVYSLNPERIAGVDRSRHPRSAIHHQQVGVDRGRGAGAGRSRMTPGGI